MSKSRLDYIDAAKGVLIIILVFHHIPFIALDLTGGLHNEFLSIVKDYRWFFYGPYFMSAFFVITGMCSNFDIDFKTLLQKNATTLLIPMLILGGGKWAWFIVTLFFAKIIYWLTLKIIQDNTNRFLVYVLSTFVVCLLYNFKLPNPFYYQHALIAAFFLCFGHVFKDKIKENKKMIIGSVLYIIVSLSYFIIGRRMPFFENGINIPIVDFVTFLISSISGSLMLLGVGHILKNIKYLRFLGNYSIVVYLTHFVILTYFIQRICGTINQNDGNFLISFGICLLLLLATVFSCTIIAFLIDNKYLRWIAGKV